MLAIGYRKLGANLQMSRFINKISTVSATTLPISRDILIQMLLYMFCWGGIMITERDRISFYIATILETAYRSEC